MVEIWRYPVTSVGGELVPFVSLSPAGVKGDREYGLIDLATGTPASPEREVRWRRALHLTASLPGDRLPALELPGRRAYSLDDRSLNAELSDYFGFAVSPAAYAHTRCRGDFPLSTYRHPHAPVHLLTTASLRSLEAVGLKAQLDSRRFRPTALIEVGDAPFPEQAWVGRRMRLGGAELRALENTKRCGITFLSQLGLSEDPEILRTIVRHNQRHLGVYCAVERPGTIRVGDTFQLIA